jgi:hypothetical protein
MARLLGMREIDSDDDRSDSTKHDKTSNVPFSMFRYHTQVDSRTECIDNATKF